MFGDCRVWALHPYALWIPRALSLKVNHPGSENDHSQTKLHGVIFGYMRNLTSSLIVVK
jgi:hypothetical protein